MLSIEQKKKIMADAGIDNGTSDESLARVPDDQFLAKVSQVAQPSGWGNTKGEMGSALSSTKTTSAPEVTGTDDFPIREEVHPNLSGRFAVKNFSSETDPKALEYLQRKNPGLQFAQKDGRIFSKLPSDKQWNPLDPQGFDMGDIGDVVADVAQPAIQGGVMALMPGAAPAELAMNAAGGGLLGYGLQKMREGVGESLGVRTPGRPDPGLLGTNQATTEAVMGALPPAARLATKGLAEASLSRMGTVPAGFYAGGIRGALAAFMGGGGLSNISRIEPAILKRYLRDAEFGPETRQLMSPETGLDMMHVIQDRTLTPAVNNAKQALNAAGTQLGQELVDIDQGLAARGYKDGVSIKSLRDLVRSQLQKIGKGPNTPATQEVQSAVQGFKDKYLSRTDLFGAQPIDFMSVQELNALKDQLRDYADIASRGADIKDPVSKQLSTMAKRLNAEISELQNRAADIVGRPKGSLEKLRGEYATKLDESSALESMLDDPMSSFTSVSGSNLPSATMKRSLIRKYVPNTPDSMRDLDMVLAARTAEKSTVNPAFGRLIPSMDLTHGYERAGKLSRSFKNPYSEAALRAALATVGEFGQEQEEQK